MKLLAGEFTKMDFYTPQQEHWAGRPGAAVGNVQQLQVGRDVQLLEGVVVEAFVTQVEDEFGRIPAQVGQQGGVIVQIAEAVFGQLAQRRLQPLDRRQVLGVELAGQLHAVGQARIAQKNGDVALPRQRRPRAAST